MGKGERDYPVTKRSRKLFPKLFGGQYRLISGRTKRYNCLTWASGRTDVWSEAPPEGKWPTGVLADGSVEATIRYFENLGFTRISAGATGLEPGVEKVAVYGDQWGYTHAARQLPNGKWTSKIGTLQDIEHDSLDALTSVETKLGTQEDHAYGRIVQILMKVKK
jgi:hypothetical protein